MISSSSLLFCCGVLCDEAMFDTHSGAETIGKYLAVAGKKLVNLDLTRRVKLWSFKCSG